MRRLLELAAVAIVIGVPSRGLGHGSPVLVDVTAGRLIVSGGLADAGGYANWIFADPDSESWFVNGGLVQFTDAPGFIINGMTSADALFLEIVPRRNLFDAARPERWLWHWSEGRGEIQLSLSDPVLDVYHEEDDPEVSLRQTTPPASHVAKIADLATYNPASHHTLIFVLDNIPAAEAGVYGFFARLTSPGYQSSEPFLVALNLDIGSSAQFQDAARLINAAAGLAADYDMDGDVDGADVLAWQRELGGASTAADGDLDGAVTALDLALWKSQFGRAVEGLAARVVATAAPEPSATVILATLAATVANIARKRRSES